MYYNYEVLDNEIVNKIVDFFPNMLLVTSHDVDVHIEPGLISTTCALPDTFQSWAEKIRNFRVRESDIWLITHPKCGTTWAQEMIWVICNDMKIDYAKILGLNERFPHMEKNFFLTSGCLDMIDKLENTCSPRFIRTHLPPSFLPVQIWVMNPKIIYLNRHPKDVAVSYYYHYKLLSGYNGNLSDFIDAFVHGYLRYGDYADHVLAYMKLKYKSNILYLTYEEMTFNLEHVIDKTSEFLGKTLSEFDKEILMQHISFKSMKENPTCNKQEVVLLYLEAIGRSGESATQFMRRGEVGSYLDELPANLNKKMDIWMKKKFTTKEINDLFKYNSI